MTRNFKFVGLFCIAALLVFWSGPALSDSDALRMATTTSISMMVKPFSSSLADCLAD